MDVQNDFVASSGALASQATDMMPVQAILEPLDALIHHARAAGVMIVNIRMTLFPDGRSNAPADLARRTKIWRDRPLATIVDSWGHENPPALRFRPEDITIQKYRNNGFVGTGLDLHLRSNGIRSVIVTGVATQACVLETALMAQSMDYYVVIPVDCVASGSSELHQAGLKVMEAVLHNEGLTTSACIHEVWEKQK